MFLTSKCLHGNSCVFVNCFGGVQWGGSNKVCMSNIIAFVNLWLQAICNYKKIIIIQN